MGVKMPIWILRGWKNTKCHLQRKHMSSCFQASHPVVKRNKKIFCFTLFYFISFEVLKIRCFDAKKIALFWFQQKHQSRFLAQPDVGLSEYTLTKNTFPQVWTLSLYSGFYGITKICLSSRQRNTTPNQNNIHNIKAVA